MRLANANDRKQKFPGENVINRQNDASPLIDHSILSCYMATMNGQMAKETIRWKLLLLLLLGESIDTKCVLCKVADVIKQIAMYQLNKKTKNYVSFTLRLWFNEHCHRLNMLPRDLLIYKTWVTKYFITTYQQKTTFSFKLSHRLDSIWITAKRERRKFLYISFQVKNWWRKSCDHPWC